ncbi:MAG: hypothetical protein ACPG21_14320 [Crocinitomicaceae bacterium]
MKLFKNIVLLQLLLFAAFAYGQKNVTTFGIQYKPIIPNRIIGTFEQDFSVDQFEAGIKQRIGNTFGMVIRRGITDMISFETGLVFTQRNYGLNFALPDSGLSDNGKVRMIAYEIPIQGMVYIRLGDQLYMNTSAGASFNYFPSDVRIEFSQGFQEYFLHEGARLNRVQGAMLANIGFEYRTKDQGYFYLGGSFNLPFAPIYTFALSYENPPDKILSIDNIRGSYLTLDLRYYFNEKPVRQ